METLRGEGGKEEFMEEILVKEEPLALSECALILPS